MGLSCSMLWKMNRLSSTVDRGSDLDERSARGMNVQELRPGQLSAIIALRLANLLALALPLGGLAFFGIFAAPSMFRVARAAHRPELAPQMVALMLGRFGWVLIACAGVALACWIADRPRLDVPDARRSSLWWRLQGAASLLVLGLSLFLQLALMPRILAMQGQVLALSDPALHASFDAAHKSYSSVASVLLWATLFVLGCLARRSVRP